MNCHYCGFHGCYISSEPEKVKRCMLCDKEWVPSETSIILGHRATRFFTMEDLEKVQKYFKRNQ